MRETRRKNHALAAGGRGMITLAAVAATMTFAGCSSSDSSSPCSIEGFDFSTVPFGAASPIGGEGNEWEIRCFSLAATTTVTLGAYPETGTQSPLFGVVRVDPPGETILDPDVIDGYRVEGSETELAGDPVLDESDFVNGWPYASVDLDAGTYLVLVTPRDDVPLDPSRVFVYLDGDDHTDEFVASGNPWVANWFASGEIPAIACPPQGYDLPEMPLDARVTIGEDGREWQLYCVEVEGEETLTLGALPIAGEQDQEIQIVTISHDPATGDLATDAFSEYANGETPLPIYYSGVLSADDSFGVLPWGVATLDAGVYLVAITPYEYEALVPTTLFVYTDGLDHLDEFTGSDNPWVLEQFASTSDEPVG